MPTRPATPRQPAALAQARLALDTLLRDRVRAMLAAAGADAEVAVAERASDDAATVDARVRWFAEQVDRHNATAQQTAGRGEVLAYERAVVIEGERGIEVVPVDEYTATPLYHEAKVGRVEQLIVGDDLLAYLHGDDSEAVTRAAEQLGLT